MQHARLGGVGEADPEVIPVSSPLSTECLVAVEQPIQNDVQMWRPFQ